MEIKDIKKITAILLELCLVLFATGLLFLNSVHAMEPPITVVGSDFFPVESNQSILTVIDEPYAVVGQVSMIRTGEANICQTPVFTSSQSPVHQSSFVNLNQPMTCFSLSLAPVPSLPAIFVERLEPLASVIMAPDPAPIRYDVWNPGTVSATHSIPMIVTAIKTGIVVTMSGLAGIIILYGIRKNRHEFTASILGQRLVLRC